MKQAFRYLALLLAFTLAAPAAAQPREPSKRDRAKAKKLYSEATEYHKAGNYSDAALKYLAAFELVPRPLFLFNVGQVYRLAGNEKKAVEYYEQYLEMEADGRGSATARKFLGELKSQLKKQQAEKEKKPDDEEKGPSEPGDDENTNDEVANSEAVTISESSEDSTGKVMLWSGLGLAIAGTVGIALGVKYGLDAKSISDELSDNQEAWTEELLAKQSKGKSAETKSLVFSSIGAAAIVGGGVLAYLGWRRKSGTERVTFVPTLSDREVGFAFTGRF